MNPAAPPPDARLERGPFDLIGDVHCCAGELERLLAALGHDVAHYRGRPAVVYGHARTREPAWVNGTTCIDQGCVFAGRLTAPRPFLEARAGARASA